MLYKQLLAEGKLAEADALSVEIENTTKAMDRNIAASKRSATSIRNWGDRLSDAIKQTISYTFSLGALRAAQQALAEAMRFTITLNTEMTKIQELQAEGAQTPEEINRLASSFNGLAKELGATTIEIAEGSVEWLRQGKSIEETSELLRSSTMLAKLGNMEAAESTEYLTSTLNSYNMSAEEAIQVVDKLVAVDNVAATSTKELATALRYSAATAQDAGVSLEQLISYIATVSSTTRQNAESIGQGMKTMFTRMQDIKAGAIDEDGLGLNNVEDALARVKIKLRDSETEFRDMGTVLEELAVKWETLNGVEQANISKAVAGVRQQNLFSVMMRNMNDALELQEVQYNSLGIAVDRYGIYLESIEGAQNKAKASLEEFFMTAEDFDSLIISANKLASELLELATNAGGIKTVVIALTTAILLLKNATIGAFLATQLLSVGGFISAINSAGMWFATLASLTSATEVATVAVGTLNTALLSNPVAIVIALAGAIALIAVNSKTANEKLEGLREEINSINQEIAGLSAKSTAITKLKVEYEELREAGDESERFYQVQQELKNLMPTLQGVYDAQGRFVIDYKGNIEDLTQAILDNIEAEKQRLAIEADQALVNQASLLNQMKKKLDSAQKAQEDDTYIYGMGGGANTYSKYASNVEEQAKAYNQAVEDEKASFRTAGYKAQMEFINGLQDPDLKQTFIDYQKQLADEASKEVAKGAQSFHWGAETTEAPTFEFGSLETQLTALTEMKDKYSELSEEVDKFGSDSVEALQALQEYVGEDGDITKYLEDGAVNLGSLRDENNKYIDNLKDYMDTNEDLSDSTVAAINTVINAVRNATREYDVFGNKISQGAFVTIAEDMSQKIWDVVEEADAGFLSVGDSVMTSAGDVFEYIKKYPEQLGAIIQSLMAISAGGAAFVRADWASSASAVNGGPSMPSISAVMPTGGGGGGGGGSSPEKEAIEAEIKVQEDKKKALQKTLDKYNEYIEAQKEALKLAKEEAEFTQELMEKNESLAELKAKIAVLELDNSEEAKAKRLKLEEDASELEQEIAEDKEDRKYELQVNALDKQQDKFEKSIKKQIEGVDAVIESYREQSSAIESTGGSAGQLGIITEEVGAKILDVFGDTLELSDENKAKLQERIDLWITNKGKINEAYAALWKYAQLLAEMDGEVTFTIPELGVQSGACFIGGTKVLMKNGQTQNIEDINIGDSVISYDTETGKFIISEIQYTFKHISTEIYKVQTSFATLNVTGNHPVYIKDKGWVEVQEISVGDNLFNGLEFVEIDKINIIPGEYDVYNLHVFNEPHNYFAEGLLVHNKVYHEGGMVESHHDGNFAGNLKSNEVFAKLLTGELVATEGQMDNFLTRILPRLMGNQDYTKSSGEVTIDVNIPITVQGNMDKDVIPDIERIANTSVINRINKTLFDRGVIRSANQTVG